MSTTQTAAAEAATADTARRIAELPPEQRARLEARLRERLARRPAAPAGVPRRPEGAPVPLSFTQEQIWLAQQLAPESAAYNVPMAVACSGPLDAERLARAFRMVITRHEVLRTTFAAGPDGLPVQLVHEEARFELPVTDLRALAADEAEARVRARLAEEAHTPFDLAAGPLLRAALMRTGEQEHVLLLTIHHIVSDAWSVNVLLAEAATAYRPADGSAGAELPALPVQYGDFAAWQRGSRGGAAYQESLGYWQQRLSGLTDTPPPATTTGRPEGGAAAGTHSLELPAEVAAGLRALAVRHRTTLFTVSLAALQVLLHRYGGGPDPVIATPVGGRGRSELEGLIGCFVNTLLLRGDVSPRSAGDAPGGEPTFAELLDRTTEATRRDFRHQEVPFEQLAAQLRSSSPDGLARTMLVLDQAAPETARDGADSGGLVLRPLDAAGPADAKRDLTFTVSETGDTLTLTLVHRTDRYEERSAERLLAHYATLLREVCADPHRPVGRLPLLTAEERTLLLDTWNATALEVPAGTFHGRFAEQAARTPHAVAVVGADGTHRYAELDRLANRLAHHLRALGVGSETPVAICLERGAWTVVALLAVLKAGGCYVPVDPAQPQERMAMMLADTAAPVVITRAALADRLPSGVRAVAVEELALDAQPDTAPEVPVDPGQAAYVLFTSGSTGRPKGVVVEHRQVLNYHTAVVSALGLEAAGYAMVQPFTFDSCVTVLSSALLGGGTLHMVDADTASDGRRLAAYFAEHAIDYLKISPSHLAALEGPGAEHRVLPRRGLILGGEGSTSSFVRELLGRAECEVLNHYGPTETTVGVTTHRPRARELARTSTVPIGSPLGNVRAYVLDGRGEPVPVGVPGELFIGGAQVTRGYLGRPGLTAERFVPDPTGAPGARMYRTGDLTRRLPDGAIEFLGRLDDQVKIRGFRIELGEVEAALAALEPVAAAAAVVREDRPGDRQLVGYLVPLPGAEIEPSGLRGELAKALPGYMVPSALVVLDALPLTAHNKLDRRALPAPPRQEAGAGRAARDEREAALCRIFAEVLGAEREPGIDESFFDLGGHSLLAMRLVAAVRAELDVEVGVRDLFEAPTVAALAERLGRALPAAALPPLVRAERPDVLPLSFAQRRLRFLNGMEGEASAYTMPVVLRLTDAVDAVALQAALDDVVERHETLRTVFPETDGAPCQVILPAVAGLVSLDVVECDEEEARARIAALSAQPFDLSAEAPLRAALFTLAPADHLLVLVLHHIAGDGWSMRPLTEDLTAAYEARARGGAPGWSPLPVQYADFALWQHEHLGDPDTPGTVSNRQLAHWTAELAGLPEEIALPADHSRPARPTHRARIHTTRTDAGVHERLTAHARAHQATLFHAVHAALAVLLTRNGAGTDVPIGTPTAGRTHRDLDQLIGFFVNTLVLRTDTTGNPTHTELLRRSREVNLAALTHQDVPFERIVEALNPSRAPHRHPLFQTVLTLNNTTGATAGQDGQNVEFEGAAKFDLSFTVTEHHAADGAPGGLTITIEYAADLFEPVTIVRLADQFQRILTSAAEHPDTPLHDIELLGGTGRAELAGLSTGAVHPLPAAALPELFAAQVARTPDATAVVCDTGTLSYAQLDTATDRLARHLVALGAGAERRVAMLQQRSAELVVSTLAVVRAGSAYVPLSESWPDERMALVLADTGAELLLVDAATRDLPFVRARAAAGVRVVDVSAPLPDAPARPVPAVQPDRLAYVMYTSGSTGTPKGVAVTHADVAALAADRWWQRDGHHERVLFHSPQAFDAATYELWVPLLSGGQVVVAPAGDLDAERIGRLIAEHRVTALWLTAGLFRLLAEDAPQSLAGVSEVMTGGDVVPAAAVRRVLAVHPGLRVVDGYGPTETTVFATRHSITAGDALGSTVPIGRPLDNMRVQVLDAALRQVPPGVPGELFIAGAGLARGYLGRPALTAERFLPDPFGEPGARMYRTGDLGRWQYDERGEGRLEFLGRTDDQIKLRGFRIEPAEIEAHFTSRPDIAQAAVLLREDNPGDQRLVAYLVPTTDTDTGVTVLDPAELRAHAAAHLPAYLVPSALVLLDTLPLTPNGKLDRRALPAPSTATTPTRAPRTPQEEVLCGLFATTLAVDHIGIDDNFFDLGGHSLLAMRLVAAVRAELDAEVGVSDLFEAPTVAALAERLGRALPATALPPLVRTEPRPARIPLSYAQARLWFLNRMEETERASYNIPVVLRLARAVDAVALQAALDDVVERHETLRTVFPETDGRPCQLVLPVAPALVPLGLVETDESGARARIAELSAEPFDLAGELPLRAALFTLAPDDHLLVLVLHHIAGDGLSMRPLTEDLTAAYQARSHARTPDWSPLPVQYADYALWQHRHLGDPDTPGTPLHEQLAHWTTRLAGLPEEIALPADHTRPAHPTHRARTHTTHTDSTVHQQLTAHARAHQATLFQAVHAALAVLLTRNGAGTDLPIGTPTAGRTHRDLDELVGFFVNTLVLRTDTAGNPTHTELLGRTRDVGLAALSHQDLPFERLVEALNPSRTPHRHPLFQTILTFNSTTAAGVEAAGTDVESESAAKFDLSFTVTEHQTADGAPGGLTVTIEYAADLFEPVTIARLADQFQRILTSAAEHPDTPLHDIDLLAEHERKALFTDWNGPSRALPGRTLPELFAAQVARTPDATAVVCDTGTLSYAQLDTAANRLARHLVAQGAGPEHFVALAVPRSVETLVAVLAVLKSGAAYLPIDLTHPGERIAYTLADARPLCVLTTAEAAAQLPVTEHPHLLLDAPDTAAALAALPAHDLTDRDRSAPLSLRNPAYVIYTSGSTGRPKGVVVEHHSLDAYLAWAREAYDSVAGRALVHSPVSFDLTVTGLFAPLTSGGTVQLIELDDQAPTAGEFDRPSFVKATPSHLALLTALPERFSPSEQLVLGGESLMGEVLDEWRRRHPGATVINEYGPTETTVGCTEFRIEPGDTAPSGVITIGRPIWNTRMYVLDESLRALPVGVGGELFIAGDLVTRGYLGRPALTAERFLPDPFGEPGARMYRTGDLGRWQYDERGEGRLEFLGRTDDQIKLRGFRIEPAEIEAHFTSRPDIAQAAVLLREDNPGDQRLVAYLVPTTDTDTGVTVLDPAELRAHAAAHLPAYLVPSALVLLDTLPLTPNGKLDRRALPAPSTATTPTRAPRTPQEEVLCGLFATTLAVDHIGIDDNFFDLGGHSLLAARLTARVREELGIQIGLRALFETPTVALLAERINVEGSTGSSDGLGQLLPLRTGGTRPPLFAVHPGGGLGWCYSGLARHLDRDRPLFALQARGLDGVDELPRSVPDMAADYLRLIREVQPVGPYHLLGWSFGGTVAHELARQLQEAGEEVALLAMLDSHPTGRFRHAGQPSEAEILSLALDGLDLDELGALADAPADGADVLGDGLPTADAVLELLRERGSVLGGLDPAALGRLVKVTANNLALARGEQPGRYRGPVLFFEALPGRGADGTPLAELWAAHVDGPVENHPLDIPHSRFTTPQALAEIGPVLAAHLR
ncbi:amino acid adenylation domain-containing protein [Streptomyces sp. NPDC006463]|uniref:non-ribosomal peptide synthetase n=1 Tax=Streptomyces sp. NPDC006463 TaxID=3364746 RepID=UPI0036A9F996